MDPKVLPGQLNNYISILHFADVSDPAGGTTPVESELKKVWAKVDDTGGDELTDGKIIATNGRKYIIRYDEQIYLTGVKMAVNDLDGIYDIHNIGQIGYKNYLVLKCGKRE